MQLTVITRRRPDGLVLAEAYSAPGALVSFAAVPLVGPADQDEGDRHAFAARVAALATGMTDVAITPKAPIGSNTWLATEFQAEPGGLPDVDMVFVEVDLPPVLVPRRRHRDAEDGIVVLGVGDTPTRTLRRDSAALWSAHGIAIRLADPETADRLRSLAEEVDEEIARRLREGTEQVERRIRGTEGQDE
jgi:hypothetical protein